MRSGGMNRKNKRGIGFLLTFTLFLVFHSFEVHSNDEENEDPNSNSNSCIIFYVHEPVKTQTFRHIDERLKNHQLLGSYTAKKLASDIPMDVMFDRCFKIKEDLNADNPVGDELGFICMESYGALFQNYLRDQLPSVSNDVALQLAFDEMMADNASQIDDRYSSIIESCLNRNLAATQKVIRTLNFESLSVFSTEYVSASRDLVRNYWKYLKLDLLREETTACKQGCNRIFWLRQLIR